MIDCIAVQVGQTKVLFVVPAVIDFLLEMISKLLPKIEPLIDRTPKQSCNITTANTVNTWYF